MRVERGDFIVQQYPDYWYVQEVALLDHGRFKTKEEAIDHKRFLDEKYKDD